MCIHRKVACRSNRREDPTTEERVINTTSTSNSVIALRFLAHQLRAYRLAAGLNQEAAGQALGGASKAKISYHETGQRKVKLFELEKGYIPLYEIPEDRQAELIEACVRSHRKDWWDSYDTEIVPDWFRFYLGLEQGASELRGYVVQLVPGLLQAHGYARAVMATDVAGLDAEEAAGRAEVRMRRQELLTREPDSLAVHYILDESVLRRVVGDPDVMADQLAHLTEIAQRPNVTLQVLTFEQGYAWDGTDQPAILNFPWPDDAGVVWIESRLRGTPIEGDVEVQAYRQAWDHLQRRALTPVESLAMIEQIADTRG